MGKEGGEVIARWKRQKLETICYSLSEQTTRLHGRRNMHSTTFHRAPLKRSGVGNNEMWSQFHRGDHTQKKTRKWPKMSLAIGLLDWVPVSNSQSEILPLVQRMDRSKLQFSGLKITYKRKGQKGA